LLAGMKVFSLLRLQRTARMLLHGWRLLLIWQFFLRWWSLGHQRRAIGRRPATVHLGLVRRRRRMRYVGRSGALANRRRRPATVHFGLVRRRRRMRNVGRGRTLVNRG